MSQAAAMAKIKAKQAAFETQASTASTPTSPVAAGTADAPASPAVQSPTTPSAAGQSPAAAVDGRASAGAGECVLCRGDQENGGACCLVVSGFLTHVLLLSKFCVPKVQPCLASMKL